MLRILTLVVGCRKKLVQQGICNCREEVCVRRKYVGRFMQLERGLFFFFRPAT